MKTVCTFEKVKPRRFMQLIKASPKMTRAKKNEIMTPVPLIMHKFRMATAIRKNMHSKKKIRKSASTRPM